MQKNSSLGKGLAELLGDKSFNLTQEDPSKKIIEIKLDKISPSPYQPRKYFDNIYLEELSESIRKKGLLQPILLRKLQYDSYEIIAGERRFRATRLIGHEVIPSIILDISDQDAMEIALIENIQRQQLSPIEEAHAIARLINELDYTHDKLSEKIGKSRSHITNMLRLLNLPVHIQKLLEESKITMGHARALISLKNPEEFANKIINENLSVRDTEDLVKASKTEGNNIIDKFKQEKKKYLSNLANDIETKINLKTKITHNGKKGSIQIKFSSVSELEEFTTYLSNIKK